MMAALIRSYSRMGRTPCLMNHNDLLGIPKRPHTAPRGPGRCYRLHDIALPFPAISTGQRESGDTLSQALWTVKVKPCDHHGLCWVSDQSGQSGNDDWRV